MRTREWLAIIASAVLACGALAPSAQAGTPPQWKESGYGYNASKTSLAVVLGEFAHSFGVELKMTGVFSQPINTRLQANSAVEFLDRLGQQYSFQWFVYNRVLYVSPLSDNVTERIEVGGESVGQAKSALAGIGLFDAKFGWGEFEDEGAIAVAGPSEYVKLIRQVLYAKESKDSRDRRKDEFEAMVFKLKYAMVDDRRVTIRDQQVVTPGVATLLSNLVAASGRGGQRSPPQWQNMGTGAMQLDPQPNSQRGMQPSPAQPAPKAASILPTLAAALPALTGGSSAAPAADEPSGAAPVRTQMASIFPPRGDGGRSLPGPSVVGDVRSNAVIVYDLPSRRPYYQQLIDALDVPPHLVEIEAMIVDISRDRLSEFGTAFAVGGSRLHLSNGTLSSGPLPGSTLMIQSLNRFIAQLHNLEGKGEARVLAKPTVMTQENLTAVLDLSQTVYLKTTGERVAQVTPVTAGTMMRVVPRIIEDNGNYRINLMIDIEDGKIAGGLTTDTPGVQRSSISTQAILADRESLVIGGYDVDSTETGQQENPWLSKLPVVGKAFTSTTASSQSRQRLFILTPRLVTGGAERKQDTEDLVPGAYIDAASQAQTMREGAKALAREVMTGDRKRDGADDGAADGLFDSAREIRQDTVRERFAEDPRPSGANAGMRMAYDAPADPQPRAQSQGQTQGQTQAANAGMRMAYDFGTDPEPKPKAKH